MLRSSRWWADCRKAMISWSIQPPEFMVIVGSGWHRLESRTSNANHHLPLMAGNTSHQAVNTSDDPSSIFRHSVWTTQGMGRKTTIEEIVRVCHFFLPKTLVMAPWRRWQRWTMVDHLIRSIGRLIQYGWSVIKFGLCFFFELTPLAWPGHPSSSRIATEPFGFQSN